jgi:hypothetical protein
MLNQFVVRLRSKEGVTNSEVNKLLYAGPEMRERLVVMFRGEENFAEFLRILRTERNHLERANKIRKIAPWVLTAAAGGSTAGALISRGLFFE